MTLEFSIEDPLAADVKVLLQTHLDFCHEVTPPEHSYALDVEKLKDSSITVFGARENGILIGVGALKVIGPGHAELKSMHTAKASRGKGVGKAMVTHILSFAGANGLSRVSLETGSHPPYKSARKLYQATGFQPCDAFGEYVASDFNTFMTILL